MPKFDRFNGLTLCVSVAFLCGCALTAIAGPSHTASRPSGQVESSSRSIGIGDQLLAPRLNPDRFRAIILGDSQLSGPNANGVRTQMHAWDSDFAGDLLTIGNNAGGYEVTFGVGGSDNLEYQSVDVFDGWGDGGPADFFAVSGHQWTCSDDIDFNGGRIARYRLNFSVINLEAPWNEPWGVGENIIARIAVRTSPNSVPAIQVRPDRGGIIQSQLIRTHALNQDWGIQIIEQIVPASTDPEALQMGIGLYFPPDTVETQGMTLQVLGVSFHRADLDWNEQPGTILGFQGRASMNVWDHVNYFSQQSREALVEMINPNVVMTMLGHNVEDNGFLTYEPGLVMLRSLWDDAFRSAGREPPIHVFVSPWGTGTRIEQPYLEAANRANERVSYTSRKSWNVSLFEFYDGVSPEIFDPMKYNMDFWHVHPGDGPTAREIAQDLYGLLFRNP